MRRLIILYCHRGYVPRLRIIIAIGRLVAKFLLSVSVSTQIQRGLSIFREREHRGRGKGERETSTVPLCSVDRFACSMVRNKINGAW